MKSAILVCVMCVMASTASAGHFFKFDPSTGEFRCGKVSDTLQESIAETRAIIEVTEQQYGDGSEAAFDAVKAILIDQVNDDLVDIANMERFMKAVIKAVVNVMNARLPPDKQITMPEMKAAIKAEL